MPQTLTSVDSDSARPTVVLVHGAFTDSSSWNDVITFLRDDGYPVVAAANPLRGLPADAACLRTVLDSVSGPLVVVGHSYGGSVVSEAAGDNPRVRALVYVAGFIPDEGESTAELASRHPGHGLALDAAPVADVEGQDSGLLYLPRDRFHEVFCADVPEDVAALMAITQRPVAADALRDRATGAAWRTIPSWNVVAAHDLVVPARLQRFMGERAGSHTVEMEASHAVAVSQPGAVARVVDDAARTAAGLPRAIRPSWARPRGRCWCSPRGPAGARR